MELQAAQEYILNRIEKELSPHLYYHSINHVLDVKQAAITLATLEKINDYDKDLLITAVLFHDSGFIYQTKNHEEKGCEIARNILPNFDYTPLEIEKTCGMIMATKIPQSPKNILEEIICDADLDYLGRTDFWEIGNNLFKELSMNGSIKNEKDWNKLQLNFLTAHSFYTKSAIALRQEKKQAHLSQIQLIISGY